MTDNELANMPDAALADYLGTLNSNAKLLNSELAKCKAEAKNRARTLQGNTYTISISEAARWSLDSAKIKAEMPEAWVTAHSKVSYVQTVQVRVRGEQVAA